MEDKKSTMVQIDAKEAATLLAALRTWQDPESFRMSDIDYFDEYEPLTAEEIDALCERINFGVNDIN